MAVCSPAVGLFGFRPSLDDLKIGATIPIITMSSPHGPMKEVEAMQYRL